MTECPQNADHTRQKAPPYMGAPRYIPNHYKQGSIRMSYAQFPPPAPKQGMSTGGKVALGCGIPTLLGLLVLGGCGALVGGAAVEVDKQVQQDKKADVRAAKDDVKLLSCEIKDEEYIGRSVKAKVKITNNGDKRANYFIEGEFLDQDGNQVDQLLATVNNLAPDGSSTQDFSGLITSEQLDGVTEGSCKILKVNRDEWSAAN